jgi:hypothetical protein
VALPADNVAEACRLLGPQGKITQLATAQAVW